MRGFCKMKQLFVVSSSNYERTFRLAQGEPEDEYDDDDEEYEKEWCD